MSLLRSANAEQPAAQKPLFLISLYAAPLSALGLKGRMLPIEP